MSSGDWYIKRLVLKNFRNYEDLEIDFGREVTLLIGENGAGKTSILDGVAAALQPVHHGLSGTRSMRNRPQRPLPSDARQIPSSLDSVQRTGTMESRYPVYIAAEVVLDGDEASWEMSRGGEDKMGRHGSAHSAYRQCSSLMDRATSNVPDELDRTLPVLGFYGVDRLVNEISEQGLFSLSRRGAYALALDSRSDLNGLFAFIASLDEQVLRAAAFGDPEPTAAKRQLSAIESACDSVLEPVDWHRLRWSRDLNDVTFHHDEHGTLPMSMLATGTKIAAGLTIDLAGRMARANPHLGAEVLLEQTPGIVMIDEVDLHLHPTWQQRIVPALRRTFPRVQFILTTHSPQVISTVEAENIRILDDSEVLIPEFSEGLRSNVILDRLQGTDPRPKVPVREKLDKYLELVEHGEGHSEAARVLRDEIDRALGGAEFNRELVDADTIIAVESWDED